MAWNLVRKEAGCKAEGFSTKMLHPGIGAFSVKMPRIFPLNRLLLSTVVFGKLSLHIDYAPITINYRVTPIFAYFYRFTKYNVSPPPLSPHISQLQLQSLSGSGGQGRGLFGNNAACVGLFNRAGSDLVSL